MEYRVEQKYLITEDQIALLMSRLDGYVHPDANMIDGSYLIRSVYFDDMYDTCLFENEAGLDNREKFRIRTYNNDLSKISLELKGKKKSYTSKESVQISVDEMNSLLNREVLFGTGHYLKTKISAEMQYRRLQPVCIVEYERTAFVDPLGNVRITFDKNISGCNNIYSFTDEHINAIPVLPTGQHILEVKYDEFLPDYIRTIIDMGSLSRTAFSKYYYARNFGEMI